MKFKINEEEATVNNTTSVTLLRLAFGDEPASNDAIILEVKETLKSMNLQGGPLVLLNGPASLPVAVTIAHAVVHIFGAVGVFDPKMAGYVISTAHGGEYREGNFIPASAVE